MELHQAIAHADLTTLSVRHDWRTGALRTALGREWDSDLDFSRYAQAFAIDQLPCATPIALDDDDTRGLFRAAGAEDALEAVIALMRTGRHEMIVMRVNAALGIRTVSNVHSSVLGHNNGHHAIRAGGIRRHEADHAERDVFVDGLNLARAMSFKNAAAEIPFGGCKMTVQSDPVRLDDAERLGFLATSIDAGHFMTGPDMGFPPELADVLGARFTKNILGGPHGSLGPTGTPTAHGCFVAMEEAATVALGGSLRGKRVAIQGVGAVGLPLAGMLADAGAKLAIADVDPARVEAARTRLGAVDLVPAEEIMTTDCDVLAPCAMGGVLDARTIDRLACKMVYGSANNQLAAVSEEEELALAEKLAARGILYQPDWTHNTAGVMAGYEEYVHRERASMDRVIERARRVCGEGTKELLRAARLTGRTPTTVAYERVKRRVYGEE